MHKSDFFLNLDSKITCANTNCSVDVTEYLLNICFKHKCQLSLYICLQDGIDGIDLYISVFKFSSVPCPTNLHYKCITVNIIIVCFQKLRCKTILFSEVISNITQMLPVEFKRIIYPQIIILSSFTHPHELLNS